MAEALRLVTGRAPALVWHREDSLPDGLDLIAIPGGFSYGDYLRSGAMAAQSEVNGSARNIAGILNEAGNVLGMMPHPERAVEAAHGLTDGRRLFEGLLEMVGQPA